MTSNAQCFAFRKPKHPYFPVPKTTNVVRDYRNPHQTRHLQCALATRNSKILKRGSISPSMPRPMATSSIARRATALPSSCVLALISLSSVKTRPMGIGSTGKSTLGEGSLGPMQVRSLISFSNEKTLILARSARSFAPGSGVRRSHRDRTKTPLLPI